MSLIRVYKRLMDAWESNPFVPDERNLALRDAMYIIVEAMDEYEYAAWCGRKS